MPTQTWTDMTENEFFEWCISEPSTPDSFNFEDAMLDMWPRDCDILKGSDWKNDAHYAKWPSFGDTPNSAHCGVGVKNFPPVVINLSQEPAEGITPGLVRDDRGGSVITVTEGIEPESAGDPQSTGKPESHAETESPEEPGSPEVSHSPEEQESPGSPKERESPEGSHSPEESVEETAPGLVQDEESITREEHKTENLLDLRTKLHKGLLTKKGRKESQMSDMSSLLRRLELHFEQLECISYEERHEYISRDDVRAAKSSVLLRAINRQDAQWFFRHSGTDVNVVYYSSIT